jgi:hypothetical protein
MRFNLTELEDTGYEEDVDNILKRRVRPTGQLKTCRTCATPIISGDKCEDCLHEYQRKAMNRLGQKFQNGHKRSHMRKFSDDQVREIRNDGRTDHRFVKEMCQKYNVRPETIYGILVLDTYKEVR